MQKNHNFPNCEKARKMWKFSWRFGAKNFAKAPRCGAKIPGFRWWSDNGDAKRPPRPPDRLVSSRTLATKWANDQMVCETTIWPLLRTSLNGWQRGLKLRAGLYSKRVAFRFEPCPQRWWIYPAVGGICGRTDIRFNRAILPMIVFKKSDYLATCFKKTLRRIFLTTNAIVFYTWRKSAQVNIRATVQYFYFLFALPPPLHRLWGTMRHPSSYTHSLYRLYRFRDRNMEREYKSAIIKRDLYLSQLRPRLDHNSIFVLEWVSFNYPEQDSLSGILYLIYHYFIYLFLFIIFYLF